MTTSANNHHNSQPLVVITGAGGNIGRSLARGLADRCRIVGIDLEDSGVDFPLIEADFTDDASMTAAFDRLAREHGQHIASVIHLVAYYDFSGEPNPLYEKVNVEGTRRLLRCLQKFEVEQFVYSSTMLVHAPTEPGRTFDESQPIDPRWAYPESKVQAEQVIREEHGKIPYVLLRLAGVYDDETSVPTFAQQIARIYERDFQSHLYSGATDAGQAMLHRDDMIDAFCRTVDRRKELPPDLAILVGEPLARGYDDLQDRLGKLIHGEDEWTTLRLPQAVSAVGAWAQDKAEPIVPDALDQGQRPFIKPFMTKMASDHYALEIGRAEKLLGWRPRHRLADELPAIVKNLISDPKVWYKANKIKSPRFVEDATEAGADVEALRKSAEARYRTEHRDNRWAHFINMLFGTWLVLQPPLIQLEDPWLAWSEIGLGAALIVLAAISLSWRMAWARLACAGIGALVMAIPFVFWTTNPAAFLSDTLVGALIFGLAVGTRPEPGTALIARMSGPLVPPGWSYNPATWTQRIPIIALALVGLYVSRYLAAYQLGLIDNVWDPFFRGSPDDPQNGTEEIITSSVSKAWPVPDAALGGYTYLLEILTGIVGTQRRWRTMPWLVVLFGLMIAPLGIVSITFIVIQPIVIGTWSTIALIGAAAMLIQIPYSLDELLATLQFIRRRVKAGKNWLRVFLFGDTDDGPDAGWPVDEFDRSPIVVVEEMIGGGVSLPWNLALAALIGLWLLFTRVSLGAEGWMANSDHLVGALVLTTVSVAAAEVARPVRFLLAPLGVALFITPFAFDAGSTQIIASFVAGVLLIVCSIPRGTIRNQYGTWDKLIV